MSLVAAAGAGVPTTPVFRKETFDKVSSFLEKGWTVFLIARHMETPANAAGTRSGGRTFDEPLNAQGNEQAIILAEKILDFVQRMAAKLRPERLSSTIYSSTLIRTIQTAAPLLSRLYRAGHPTSLELEHDLRERESGWAEGKTKEEIKASFGEGADTFTTDPEKTSIIPGSENARQVAERALKTLGAIADKHPGCLIPVISSGKLIRAVVWLCCANFSKIPKEMKNGDQFFIAAPPERKSEMDARPFLVLARENLEGTESEDFPETPVA